MKEIEIINWLIQNLQSTTNWMGDDVANSIKLLKETINDLIEGKNQFWNMPEKCRKCPMVDSIQMLTNSVSTQIDHSLQFEKRLEQREQEISSQNKLLEDTRTELYTDSLTKTNNRNKYEVDFDKYILDFKENGHSFSYSILDIDFFKKVNDEYWHNIGDAVLKRFASEIEKIINNSQYSQNIKLYRIGGEEFCIMWNICKRELFELLMSIRKFFNDITYEIRKMDKKLSIRFSAWVSQWDKKSSKQWIYEDTDKLLYNSKNNWRNQITLESDDEDIIK